MSSVPFVGRSRELQAVLRRVGEPSVTVLTGIAGIGKTRLAREVARQLSGDARWQVVVRQATSMLHELPLGLFSDLIDPDRLPTSAGEAIQGAYRELVDQLVAGRSLVVVDDAPLIDASSALVLQRLVENGVASVVLTCRSGQAVPEGLDALARADAGATIVLGGLDAEDARSLASAVVSESATNSGRSNSLDEAGLDEVCRLAEGVPLFLLALVRARTGADRESGGNTLAELVRRAVGGHRAADLETLELVALGEPIELTVMERLVDGSSLERLEAAGLIAVVHDRRRRAVHVAHPLYAEAVLGSLGELRRRRLLRTLAGELSRFGGRRDDELRIVLWRRGAGDAVAPDAVVRAASQALARGGLALAEELLTESVDASQSLAAACLLAGIHLEQGRGADAVAVCSAAPLEGSDELRAKLGVTWSIGAFAYVGDIAAAAAVLDRLRGTVALPWRRELDQFEIAMRFYIGDVTAAVGLVDALLGEPDVPERTRVWFMLPGLLALATGGRTIDAVALAEDARTAAPRFAEEIVSIDAHAHCVWAYAALLHGELRGRPEVIAARRQAALDAGDDGSAALLQVVLGMLRTHEGHLVEAASLLDLPPSLPGGWGLAALAFRVTALVGAGRLPTAAALVPTLTTVPQFQFHHALNRLAVGVVAAGQGDLDAALAAFDDAATHAAGHGQHAFASIARFRAFAAVPSDVRAQTVLDEVARHDGALGAAFGAAAAGWIERRPEAVAAARDLLDEMGCGLYAALVAEVEVALADLVGADRRTRQELVRARDRRSKALRASRRPALAGGAVADDLSVATAAESAATPDGLAILTPREREVARLAADGAGDQAIAGALGISARTVHAHLRSVYAKLGLSGRHELPR